KLLRAGNVVEQVITAQIQQAIRNQRIRRNGDFLWPVRTKGIKPRRPVDGTPLRKIDHVPAEELEAAALLVTRLAGGIEQDDLILEVGRVLGYLRTGANVEKAARGAVSRLVRAGVLVERAGFLVEDTEEVEAEVE